MPDKPMQPSKVKTDDFKLIDGIDETIEARLKRGHEITTFRRLAEIPAHEIRLMLSGLPEVSNNEIENWLQRAKELAREDQLKTVLKEKPAQKGVKPALKNTLKNAEPFTEVKLAEVTSELERPVALEPALEVMKPELASNLDKVIPLEPVPDLAVVNLAEEPFATVLLKFYTQNDNEVKQTHVTHQQSQIERQWDGWDVASLENFLTGQVQLRLPQAKSAPVIEQGKPEGEILSFQKVAPDIVEVPAAEFSLATANTSTQKQDENWAVSAAPLRARTAARVQLTHLRLAGNLIGEELIMLNSAESYSISMRLNLPDSALTDVPLNYTATVYAKRLGGARQIAGETRGLVTLPGSVAIEIQGTTLPPGNYHLEALVVINKADASAEAHSGYIAWSEMGLVEVS